MVVYDYDFDLDVESSGENCSMIGANTTSLLVTHGMDQTLSSFLSRDLARLILVILPVLTGVILSVLIVYGEHTSNASREQSHSTVFDLSPVEVKPSSRHSHRNVIIATVLVIIIGIMILGGATLGVLDYYTFRATGVHLHFNLPVVTSTGNSFLDLGTLMLVALIAGVLLIVGIMVLAISLNPKPEDLVGWTRPEPLPQAETGSVFTGSINSFTQPVQSNRPPPKRVICRYCGHDIANGRYCSECHLTSGYVVSNR